MSVRRTYAQVVVTATHDAAQDAGAKDSEATEAKNSSGVALPLSLPPPPPSSSHKAAIERLVALVTRARVYYNAAWIAHEDLARVLAVFCPTSPTLSAIPPCPPCLPLACSADVRICARKKVLVAWSVVRATARFVVVLHAAACRMDDPDLEPRFFIRSHDDVQVRAALACAAATGRRPTVLPLNVARVSKASPLSKPLRYFDAGAFRACVAEDLRLIFTAFEAEVERVNALDASLGGAGTRRGLLKLPALGLGLGVALADGTPVGALMFEPFMWALRDVLRGRDAWPFLEAIELPDFSGGAFTPRFSPASVPVRLVVGQSRDILIFTDEEASRCVCGVVAPCSPAALPGHALARGLERSVADQVDAFYAWPGRAASDAFELIPVRADNARNGKKTLGWPPVAWPPVAWRQRSGSAS